MECIPAAEEWDDLPKMKCEDCPWYVPEMYDDGKDGSENAG